MILDRLDVDPSDLAHRTGWEAKTEGLCKGDACVPIPANAWRGDRLDAAVVAERLGAPLEHDEAHGVWSLGPEGGGRVLADASLPEIVLPDADGNPFDLASLRGQKVLLVAWASW